MLPTQLRTFYAVAREGSFTAAARVLHVSQPTLTSQIKKLEASYGIDLFRRHGRGVELTETGKQLLKIAHRIISNQDEAVTFLKAVNNLEAGHLKIGAVGPYQAAEILSVFHLEPYSAQLGRSIHRFQPFLQFLQRIFSVFRPFWAHIGIFEDFPYESLDENMWLVLENHISSSG